jgi:hypothetical protein
MSHKESFLRHKPVRTKRTEEDYRNEISKLKSRYTSENWHTLKVAMKKDKK